MNAQTSLFDSTPAPQPLRWRLSEDSSHATSQCGRYRVSRAFTEQGEVFDAWYGRLADGNLRHLYSGASKADAIAACTTDSTKQTAAAAASTKG